jgi:hypothetical protein
LNPNELGICLTDQGWMSTFAGGFVLVHSRIGAADDLGGLRVLRPVGNANTGSNVLESSFAQLTFNPYDCRPKIVFVTLLGDQGKLVATKPVARDAIVFKAPRA